MRTAYSPKSRLRLWHVGGVKLEVSMFLVPFARICDNAVASNNMAKRTQVVVGLMQVVLKRYSPKPVHHFQAVILLCLAMPTLYKAHSLSWLRKAG